MISTVVVAALSLQLGAANAALDKCRKLDKEFDTKNMPKPCQAAADDTTITIPERVEALRLLAFAHILNGDEALAEPAFLKMLVFHPSVELPADAGPRFREIFADVRKRFDAEGALQVTFVAPTVDPATKLPVELQIDLVDKLGRVTGARVRSTPSGTGAAPLEERLVRSELAPGQLRFTGRVPEPTPPSPDGYGIRYDVVFEGWDGSEQPVAPLVGGTFSRSGDGIGGGGGEEGEFPWLWVGVGTASAVVVASAAGGGLAWCFLSGPCRTQNAFVRIQVSQGAPQ